MYKYVQYNVHVHVYVPDGSCVMIPVSCSLVTSDGSGGLSERALPLVKVNPTNGRWRVRAVILVWVGS